MFDLIKFLSKEDSSKNVAKERLKLVLVHDRSHCSPEILEMIRENLLDSLADYIDFDEKGLEVKIMQTEAGADGRPALIANIPIKNMKR